LVTIEQQSLTLPEKIGYNRRSLKISDNGYKAIQAILADDGTVYSIQKKVLVGAFVFFQKNSQKMNNFNVVCFFDDRLSTQKGQ
jgi:hypothetical protein